MANLNLNSKKSLCVCLCIYKSEDGLPYVLANLHKIYASGIFSRFKVMAVYEANEAHFTSSRPSAHSSCSAYELLTSFANHLPINSVEIIKNAYPTTHVRQRNIGNARNTCLNRLRSMRDRGFGTDADTGAGTETYDYFAMMDANNYSCIGPVDTDVLREAVSRSEEWDAVSFLREAGYYDYWALSFDPYIYSFFHFNPNWYEICDKMNAAFKTYMEIETSSTTHSGCGGGGGGGGLLPVYSAFNGFALYKSAVYLCEDLRYSDEIDLALFPADVLKKQIQLVGCGTDGRINDDCEHRYFHLASMQPPHNARIYIYSKFLFKKVPDTDRPSRFHPRAPV